MTIDTIVTIVCPEGGACKANFLCGGSDGQSELAVAIARPAPTNESSLALPQPEHRTLSMAPSPPAEAKNNVTWFGSSAARRGAVQGAPCGIKRERVGAMYGLQGMGTLEAFVDVRGRGSLLGENLAFIRVERPFALQANTINMQSGYIM